MISDNKIISLCIIYGDFIKFGLELVCGSGLLRILLAGIYGFMSDRMAIALVFLCIVVALCVISCRL